MLTVSSVDRYSVSPDTWHLFKLPAFCSLIIIAGVVCVELFVDLCVKCFFTVGCWAVRFLSMTHGRKWLLKFKLKWGQNKFYKYLLSIKLGVTCVQMCYTKAYRWKHSQTWSYSCLKGRNLVLYAFFWVIPRRLKLICQRFGTLCLFHIHRRVGDICQFHLHRRVGDTYPPMKMEQTERSETMTYKVQMPGNYPEERTQHSEQGESLKSRRNLVFYYI
jgi:hypothetical protein